MKRSTHLLRRCLTGILLLLFSLSAFSQGRKVTGKVSNSADNQPLPGVTVQVKGGSAVTTTDAEGNYSIDVSSDNTTLVFTSVGMQTSEVRVGNRASVNVVLERNDQSLADVVVVGYGTTRKSDLTGAVATVKSAQLQERPAASLNQALAGRMPGVQVNTNSGRPGGQTNVRVRGFSSILATSNPLYIVDGVALPINSQSSNSNSIDFINPNDIASVEVLKDASATAIYGARGANGVIMITTKRGSRTGARITYDVDMSVPTIGPQRVEMLNAKEYLEVENLAYDNIKVYDPAGWNSGAYANVVDPRVKRKSLPLLFDSNGNPLYDTDWLKESTQNKLSQSHQLGITGGNPDASFGAYLGFRDDNGLLLNSYLKRYSGRFVFDVKAKEWLKFGGNLGYHNQQENIVDQGTGGLNSVRMITEAFPFLPVKYPDGTWAENYHYPGAEGGSNPVHILNERQLLYNTQTTLGDVYVNINIAKGLEFRSQVGVNVVTRNTREYSGRTLDQISRNQNGVASQANSRETFWSSENYFTYNTKFGADHNLTAMLGLSWQENSYTAFSASAQNFTTDFYLYNNLVTGAQQNPAGSSTSEFSLNSYFARINYGYKDKYLLTFTGRADGSSKFGPNSKWGYFPSAAIGWRASEEDFLKNSNTISNLKLRASVGATGNSEIPAYLTDPVTGSFTGILGDTRVAGVGTGRIGNEDLKWEKTTQYDAGVELGLFQNRITIEADYYYRKTTDMLLNAPVPTSSGYTTIAKNIGSMENKGFEFAINTVNVNNKDFGWNSTFNISLNRNKVLSLATPADIFGTGGPNFTNQTNIIRIGEPVGSFWGLTRLGVWTAAEAAEAAKFSPASYRGGKPILPGDIKYLDVNGDYQINDADRSIIGNGNPKGWGSFFNTFRYKNFELLLEIQYVYGNDILNMMTHSGEDRVSIANSFATVLDAYDPAKGNTGSQIATIRDTRAGYVTNVDTRWVQDGSFIRGKNLLLSYNFSSDVYTRLHLNRLRVYASVQNFFLSTKYRGNDPEVTTYGNAFAQGQTFFDYPKPTLYTFGINIGL
jgi:TonB-linked SusC/RagA family outer membrane protein